MSPTKLKELIRQIRAARTAADERAVVHKECAYIRALFREEDSKWRCRNVAKLLFIHLFGYPVHFGQLECLKLIASPRFTDKRIGYLGSMLLLDERQDVHLLITNSLKNDLHSHIQYNIGLALCTLGAICSPELSRNLAGEVERLLKTSNAYIRKKAALCAFCIIKKIPDSVEIFIPATISLLSEKNHNVLTTAVILITEMCEKSSDVLHHFKKLATKLVQILKDLITVGYSPAHDVCGVRDPFLQVKLLKLLRILGKNDSDISKTFNDILVQVATDTDTSKNVGNAVLYETVTSILDIKCESALKVLGVNILGRFLLNTDRNIRYVALNMLLHTIQADYDAVQRHRNIIVECLKDPDESIKKRAMELSFALVNPNNIQSMTTELLDFLENADPEFKSKCSFNIFVLAEKYSPSKRWHIDTMIEVLMLAGNYVIDDVVGNLIQLISESSFLHMDTVKQLWKQLTGDLSSKQPLVQVAAWCIGEFGDLLYFSDKEFSLANVTPDEIIDVFERLILNSNTTLTTKEFIITASMKLSVRFHEVAMRVKIFLDALETNINIELQQRAVEFSLLFGKFNHLMPSLLERMPIVESKQSHENTLSNGDAEDGFKTTIPKENRKSIENSNVLINLLSSPNKTPHLNQRETSEKTNISLADQKHNWLDLLDELNLMELTWINQGNKPNSRSNFIPTTNLKTQKNIPSLIVFEKNGLKIIFEFEKPSDNPHLIIINVVASNYSITSISNFIFQAAVPKGFQLQILPPTDSKIAANNTASIQQKLIILNPNQSPLRMKLRIFYVSNGNTVLEEVEVNNIPQAVYK